MLCQQCRGMHAAYIIIELIIIINIRVIIITYKYIIIELIICTTN